VPPLGGGVVSKINFKKEELPMKQKSPFPSPTEAALNLVRMREDCADPMGSYTGRPTGNEDERPIQDADDL
jgi:hypothetical protein